MLTAILLETPNHRLYAPGRLDVHSSLAGRIIAEAALNCSSDKKPRWLLDNSGTATWPGASFFDHVDSTLLPLIDSFDDYWLVAGASSLTGLMPQIDQLLVFQCGQIHDWPGTELPDDFQNLAVSGFQPQSAGISAEATRWQRPSCVGLLAALTAAGSCDLHLHTNFSDGADSPESLVDQVLANGLEAFAISDHDNLAALLPAQLHLERRLAATASQALFIPGVELSIDVGRELHLLGYFPRGGQEINRAVPDPAA